MRVLIAVFTNAGNEPEALRQVLESFGCMVLTKYVGRPNDFISILGGIDHFDPDAIILSGHGKDEKFIMPVLDNSVYTEDEPKGDFSSVEINQYHILNTCSLAYSYKTNYKLFYLFQQKIVLYSRCRFLPHRHF